MARKERVHLFFLKSTLPPLLFLIGKAFDWRHKHPIWFYRIYGKSGLLFYFENTRIYNLGATNSLNRSRGIATHKTAISEILFYKIKSYSSRGLTLLVRWRCRSVSRGWGWRCVARCWGRAGRPTGSPPAGRAPRTPRTPSCTRTGTWQRNTCCSLSGSRTKWWNAKWVSRSHAITCFLISAAFPPPTACCVTSEKKHQTRTKITHG